MSGLEMGAWALLMLSGLVSALAFGHSLAAPMRAHKTLLKWIKANPPPKPRPLPDIWTKT